MSSVALPSTMPVIGGLPVIGALPALLRNPLQFLHDAAETAQAYGDVVRLRIGPKDIYLINSPAHIKYVLQDHRHNYIKGTMWKPVRELLGNGLLASDGDVWLRRRRLMQPAFHRQKLAGIVSQLTDQTRQKLDTWQPYVDQGRVLDFSEDMVDLTMRVIVKAMFSYSLSEDEVQRVGRACSTALAYINYRIWTFFLPRSLPLPGKKNFKKANAIIDETIYRVIRERRQQQSDQAADLISMLLDAKDADTGQGLTDEEIRDELMTIFLAGHETTAIMLSWVLYFITQHPEVERKLYAEVDALLGDRPPTFEDLAKLDYTRMIMEEALRFYPAVWLVPRTVVADDTIGGYPIPAGATVLISPYTMHHNSKFWSNPAVFDPERFSAAEIAKRDKLAYVPFGAGPRQCIGNNFAQMEIHILLVMLAQRYRVKLVPDLNIKPRSSTTLRPSPNVLITLHSR